MPKDSNRRGNSRNENWSDGVMDLARERPIAAAAVAAGAAAAGLFLWSKRNQISQQLSDLTDQIGEWSENMSSASGGLAANDDTGGLTTSARTGGRSSSRATGSSRSTSGSRGRNSTSGRGRGMSETGGGNASLGAQSGGMGTSTTASPSGRGGASDNS